MDFTDIEPDAETQRILTRILVDFAPDDPAVPWTGAELRILVSEESFPVPDLARAVLSWAGYVDQRWEEKTAWRVGGRFRGTNVSLASTKFGLRAMVEINADVAAGLESVAARHSPAHVQPTRRCRDLKAARPFGCPEAGGPRRRLRCRSQ